MVRFSEVVFKMKTIIFVMIIILLLITGCTAEISDSSGEEGKLLTVGSTDAEILKEFPDGLDEALQELDLVEE